MARAHSVPGRISGDRHLARSPTVDTDSRIQRTGSDDVDGDPDQRSADWKCSSSRYVAVGAVPLQYRRSSFSLALLHLQSISVGPYLLCIGYCRRHSNLPASGEILPLCRPCVFPPSRVGFMKSRFLCVTESSTIAYWLSPNGLLQAPNTTKHIVGRSSDPDHCGKLTF